MSKKFFEKTSKNADDIQGWLDGPGKYIVPAVILVIAISFVISAF